MTKPVNVLKEKQQEIRYRDRIIIALVAILFLLGGAYIRFPSTIQVYHTPTLESAVATKIDYIPPSTVYSFAVLLWERINYCQNDCAVDYLNNLNSSRPFLTERCYFDLKDHAVKNNQLYKNRARQLTLLDSTAFNPSKVIKLDNKKDTWVVTETFGFDETIHGTKLRNFNMKYPLQIVKHNVSDTYNPYNLQLDCFSGTPTRIDLN